MPYPNTDFGNYNVTFTFVKSDKFNGYHVLAEGPEVPNGYGFLGFIKGEGPSGWSWSWDAASKTQGYIKGSRTDVAEHMAARASILDSNYNTPGYVPDECANREAGYIGQ